MMLQHIATANCEKCELVFKPPVNYSFKSENLRSIHTVRVCLRFLDILMQMQRMGYIPILCIKAASS